MSLLQRISSALFDREWRMPAEAHATPVVSPAVDHPATLSPTPAVSQGPPPTGPRKGTIVAVSVYVPFGTDLGLVVARLVTLGYQQIEHREAKHDATRSRVSARAIVPVLTLNTQAVAAQLANVVIGAKVDVQTWPAY